MGPRKKMRIEEDNEQFDESKEIAELVEKINLLTDLDPKDVTNFKDFPISQYTLKGLTETDFITPTKVQRQTLIHTLRGKDIVAASKTGSGKTLAFIIPMLEVLYRNSWSSDDGIGALVITPTRELAYQLFELLKILGRYHSFSTGLIIGGKDLKYEWKNVGMLNIIICTPGRIMQHITENSLFAVDNLQILILDEADECLSLGFEKTMKVIFRSLPKDRQTILFSATQTKNIKELSMAGCKDAVMCFTHENSKTMTPKRLVEAFYVCRLEDKIAFLWTFIKDHLNEKLLVFVTTCKQARFIADVFGKLSRNLNILMLHGGMHQLRRMAVYDEYCQKNSAVMIATDVAARGLDFPSVHWVVQLDCPESAKVYIHRVGRTARFDDEGRTVLIVTPSQKEPMLTELTAHNIKVKEVEEYPSIFTNVNKRIENELAKNIELQGQAERVFFCYLKAVCKMKREFCDLTSINFDAFARSLGLAKTPDTNFLNRKLNFLRKVNEAELAENEQTISEKNTDMKNEISYISVDELLTTADQRMTELVPISAMPANNTKEFINKYSIAKNIIQKGIKVNSRIIFDDDDDAVIEDLELPTEESNEGIDYSYYLNKIQSEDKIDRKVHKNKQKEKKDNKRKYTSIIDE